MSSQRQIKISACMMVKNEEELLPQCLKSIKDVVDEIIVVDTGSEDRTVEIAESYGAKVYHHPWENDFSKHRNQSITYATGDWFLIIDADERVDAEILSVEKIKNHLATLKNDVDAVMATVVDHRRDETENVRFKSARLFRNNVGIHYEGIVHNKPVYEGSPVNSDLEIHHYGYDLDQAKMDAKFVRTTNLLKQRINEKPDDFEAYFYLANSYGSKKDLEKTIEYTEKAIELMPDDSEDKRLYNSCYYTLTGCYSIKNEYAEARKWAHLGLEKNENDIGIYFHLVNIALKDEDYYSVKKWALKYLHSYEIIAKDPIVSGGQFIFHVDESSRQAVRYWLLSAHLILHEIDELWEVWGFVKEKVYSDKNLQVEVLKNAKIAGESSIIIRLTTEFFTRTNPNNYDLLVPVTDWILNNEYPNNALEEFIQYLQKSSKNAAKRIEDYTKYLYEQRQFNLIFKIEEVIPTSISKAYNFQFLLIKSAYEAGNKIILEKQFASLLEYVDSFSDLQEDILLILSKYLLESEAIDTFIDVTNILVAKRSLVFNSVISDLGDFAKVYELLSENYLKEPNYYLMQLALEISFNLTGNFDKIKKIGNNYFAAEEYKNCIKFYNMLLQNNCADRQSYLNLKDSFLAIGNTDGAAKCEQLLETL